MSVYEFGPFQLDSERLLLLDGGEPVALGPKVVETLLALVERPGDVLTKTLLLDRIWPEGYVDEANLAQNVYVLRKSLRARLNADAIETIPRRGYRFTLPVRRVEALPPAQPSIAASQTPAPSAVAARPRSPVRRFLEVAAAAVLAIALTGGMLLALFAPHRAAARSALSVDGARLYEIGRYYWNQRTKEGTEKSLAYFARVIDTDPKDARGYAALASANAIMGDYEYGPARPSVYFARAREYARKALAIDPNYGEAYAVLGMISNKTAVGSNRQMTQSVHDLERAIQLDPSSGPAHEWYGIALLQLGRIDEAYAQLRSAAELDPLSVATTVWLSQAAYLERRYDDAIAYAREALDLSPSRQDAYEIMGLAYEARGDYPRAVDAYVRFGSVCSMCKAEAASLLAAIYARSNDLGRARAELSYAQAHRKDVSPENLALALAAVGERQVAISVLRKLARPYNYYLRAELRNDPRFASLRQDAQVADVQKPA